ncbi:RNA-directed DNA polymerase, eukaryota, reverse transcriptase zinc-binding domain protein [Tanacetum coccineum]
MPRNNNNDNINCAVIGAAQRKRIKYEAKCADLGYAFPPFSFFYLEELEGCGDLIEADPKVLHDSRYLSRRTILCDGDGKEGVKWQTRSSVLVNGSPTSEFSIKRGLRQGDPLSPFLFIIIMEGLQIILQNAVCSGLIHGAMIGNSGHKLSHLFYADDVVIISEWNRQDMDNIIRVLQVFFLASGLKINVSKSNVFGIGVSSQDIEDMARDAGCGSGSVPFSYLGLPIGVNMHLTANWQPLIDRFRAKLSTWKANTLSIGGRLTLIKSGESGEKKKMAWFRWESVLASFNKGGLGIGSLKAFNLALLQKSRWRFANNPDSLCHTPPRQKRGANVTPDPLQQLGRNVTPDPFQQLVIKAIHGGEAGLDLKGCNCNGVCSSIVSSYAMLHERNILPINTLCRKVGGGSSIRFWKDNWNGNGPLMLRFNRLCHLDVNTDCLLSDLRINDIWVWNWKRQVMGSRNEAALALLVSELGQVQFSDSPDSLPTRLNLSLRGLEIPSIECPICNIGMESVDHVFFGCELAFNNWRLVRVWTDIDITTRKRGTGDGIFPGDICRQGRVDKRQKWVLRGTNSRRLFSQRIQRFSPATCRRGYDVDFVDRINNIG